MGCGINSNKFATPDPSITHIKNPLKSALGKKVTIRLLFLPVLVHQIKIYFLCDM